jgi:hypothetical protein
VLTGSDTQLLGASGLPIPGQQFGDVFGRVAGGPREDVGEIDLWVDAVELCRLDEYIAAARRPPASDPAKR